MTFDVLLAPQDTHTHAPPQERSRKKSSGSGNKIILQAEQTDHIAKTITQAPTDDSGKYSWVSMGTGKALNAKVTRRLKS